MSINARIIPSKVSDSVHTASCQSSADQSTFNLRLSSLVPESTILPISVILFHSIVLFTIY